MRAARCSADDQGSQFGWPQPYSMSGRWPGGAKTFARSQPILLPKQALACLSR